MTKRMNLLAPVHPGTILRDDFLEPMGLKPAQLARILKVAAPTVNQIVRGRKSVTASMALRLEKALGSSAQFWLNIQARYDLDVAKSEIQDSLKGIRRIHASSHHAAA